MSIAAALVLRDRTNADPHQVLSVALDELVSSGVWRAGRRWRRLRRVPTLAPVSDAAPPDLQEPLRATDALLRRVADDLAQPFAVADAAAWVSVHDTYAAEGVLRDTIEDLVARDLLERTSLGEAIIEGKRVPTTTLGVTLAGESWLIAHRPPPAVRPAARDERRRRAGLRGISPLGAAFVTAWLAAPTSVRGFAYGAVGAGSVGNDFADSYDGGGASYGANSGGGGCPPGGGAC